jgi:MarR family transcriptional regulator, organic hydroperoxide resistance regulator
VETPSKSDQLDSEILEAMGELSESLLAKGEQIARRLGVPAFCLKALHLLAAPMAMRDLGRKMHCDPSFVTAIADLLEKQGLARREPCLADRRIKNLVLTSVGMKMRERVSSEFIAHVPWRDFSDDERACLLTLIRKMIRANANAASDGAGDGADQATTPPSTGGQLAGEVNETPITVQPGG